jgi:hypothetical protein
VIKRMSCGPFNEVCCRARMVAGMLTAIKPSFLGLAHRGGPLRRAAFPTM